MISDAFRHGHYKIDKDYRRDTLFDHGPKK